MKFTQAITTVILLALLGAAPVFAEGAGLEWEILSTQFHKY
jgi:hypothetical protein